MFLVSPSSAVTNVASFPVTNTAAISSQQTAECREIYLLLKIFLWNEGTMLFYLMILNGQVSEAANIHVIAMF